MATRSGQQINLQNAGLIQAAGRRLSAPLEDEGSVGPATPGLNQGAAAGAASSLDPFTGYQLAPQAAQAPQAPQLRQFSFNPKYGQLAAGFDRAIADAGLQRNNQIFQANDVYNTQLSDAQRQQQQAVMALQRRLASRGLGSSSILLNERGEQEQSYNRFVDNLGRIRANNLANAETGYARNLEDVNRQREGLFFQQVQEEEEMARQRAREEAERRAREEQIRMQQEWQAQQAAIQQQQMAAAQEAARAQAAQQAALLASIGGGGGGGGGYRGGGVPIPQQPTGPAYGLPNGQTVGEDAFMQAINTTPDMPWLNALWDYQLGLNPTLRQAILSRIAPSRGWTGGSLAAL